MGKISFETKLYKINSFTILRLSEEASAMLPSRGMTMVEGIINGVSFKTVLEPDGRYGPGLKPSHWFEITGSLQKDAQVKVGDTVNVELSPTKDWVNPEVPPDMKKALVSDISIHRLWNDITPMARWDWVRWVRAVKTPETRSKHIDVMISKLSRGMRRPCCFNRNMCSDPRVCKNWVLLDPQL